MISLSIVKEQCERVAVGTSIQRVVSGYCHSFASQTKRALGDSVRQHITDDGSVVSGCGLRIQLLLGNGTNKTNTSIDSKANVTVQIFFFYASTMTLLGSCVVSVLQ